MRIPRLNGNAWVCLIVLAVLFATVGEQTLRSHSATATDMLKPRPQPEQPDAKFAGPFKIGQVAPDFTLKDAKGRPVSLHQFRGKRVLLNFFCGCSFCQAVAVDWQHLLKEPGLRPTAVLAVAHYSLEHDKEFRKETGATFPILFDTEHRDISTRYDSHICPRVWVLDEQGRILYTNPSPIQAPPGPEMSYQVRKLVSRGASVPSSVHAGVPRSTSG
jgi:peroxiredoxin